MALPIWRLKELHTDAQERIKECHQEGEMALKGQYEILRQSIFQRLGEVLAQEATSGE